MCNRCRSVMYLASGAFTLTTKISVASLHLYSTCMSRQATVCTSCRIASLLITLLSPPVAGTHAPWKSLTLVDNNRFKTLSVWTPPSNKHNTLNNPQITRLEANLVVRFGNQHCQVQDFAFSYWFQIQWTQEGVCAREIWWVFAKPVVNGQSGWMKV